VTVLDPSCKEDLSVMYHYSSRPMGWCKQQLTCTALPRLSWDYEKY